MSASVNRLRRAVVVASIVTASVAVAACDSKVRTVIGGSVLQPSVVTVTSATVVQIEPSFLGRQSVVSFACPAVPPQTTTFRIVVQPSTDVSLRSVTFQFINGSSISGTVITFPQGDLERMFGPTFIPARTTRSFPFTQAFGCFPQSPTSMTANVVLADASGRTQQQTLTASIQ
jgi:hypothetical protein